jgi:hypothetical protein
MVCPFKKPYPSAVHAVFNSTISAQRIAIEHTFGILKARFTSITNVSIRIEGGDSHKAVVDWFLGACILHNFLMDVDDREWDNSEDKAYAARHQVIVEQARKLMLIDYLCKRRGVVDNVGLLGMLRLYGTRWYVY